MPTSGIEIVHMLLIYSILVIDFYVILIEIY